MSQISEPYEPEFQQAYNEVVSTLKASTLLKVHPEYERAIPVLYVPERVIQFRVPWEDDEGKLHVQQGFRLQYNSALGPYKGGLRLHPSVNQSILRFLGFEQTFKNALITSLNLGGGKGGANFDPKGKSDAEIRRFCVSFIRQLSRYIGSDTDVPAGDIGTGGREIGFMFGAYKQMQNKWEGVLTGKGLSWGGSLIRSEATGYGLDYYVEKMLEKQGNGGFAGKRVAISGSGNVAQYAALKAIELGATVVSLSDSKGALINQEGFTPEQVLDIQAAKVQFKSLSEIYVSADSFKGAKGTFKYIAGARPWTNVGKVDIALPCATQNEVSEDEAKALVAAGVTIVAEGSNMGCTKEAIDVFEAERASVTTGTSVWYAPGKASNLGGVAVSGLEMAQNSQRIHWTAEEVDSKLKDIMIDSFENCYNTAIKYTAEENKSALPSLVMGANVAGFIRVADAMHDQGDWW